MRYCFSLLLFVAFSAPGQDVARLEQKLARALTEADRGTLLCSLSLAYVGTDSANVFSYAENALRIFKREGDDYGVGQAYLTLGSAHFDYDHLTQAKTYYCLAKTQFKQILAQDSSLKATRAWVKSTLNLSATLGRQELNKEMLEYIREVEPVARQIQDDKTLAIIHTNLGVHFNNREDYFKAYEYFKASESFYRRFDGPMFFIQDRLIFAQCLYSLDSLVRMAEVLSQTKALLRRHPGGIHAQIYHLAQGKYHLGQQDYGSAVACYDSAYALVQQSKVTAYLESIYQHYAEVYEKMGDYDRAKAYVMRYVEEGKKDADPEDELSAIRQLAKYEAQQQHHASAYQYLQRYVHLSDSLNVAATQKEFAALEQQYQAEKREKEILSLKQQNSEAALALEKQRSHNYLVGLVAIALALILMVGYLAFRHQQRRMRAEHQRRTDEVNHLKHAQQAQKLSALIEGQEQERKRLASDLHDGLGGRLSGISLKLSQLGQERLNGSAYLVHHMLKDLDDSLVELRSIARNLTPETLSHYGLQAALEDYCSSLDQPNTRLVLQFYGDDAAIDENTRLTLYRIVQELISNAVKYAQANEILVQYMRDGNHIDITVEDDGVGFATDQPVDASHMGLTNIRNRVSYLNGTLDIQSSAQEGTTVNIQLHV